MESPTRGRPYATAHLSIAELEEVIVRCGSLRKAAKELGVGRPGIVQRLTEAGRKTLDLQVILLVPGEGMTLSPEAEAVLSEPEPEPLILLPDQAETYWKAEAEKIPSAHSSKRGAVFTIEQLRFIRRAGMSGNGCRSISKFWGLPPQTGVHRLEAHGLRTEAKTRTLIVNTEDVKNLVLPPEGGSG